MTGLTDFPYHACQAVPWAKELALVNRQDKKNVFKWERVVNNLPVTSTYDCCWPWVYKEKSYGIISDGLFVYVDNGRPIGPTEEVCWESSRKWGSMCSWLEIQYSSRKVQGSSQEPGPWSGMVTHTMD